jgi:lantibiotic biosynthesis protein
VQDAGEPPELIDELIAPLLAQYDPETLLGYRDEGPSGLCADRPGFLQGMPGVLLVLLAASCACEPKWDRIFALA